MLIWFVFVLVYGWCGFVVFCGGKVFFEVYVVVEALIVFVGDVVLGRVVLSGVCVWICL